MRRLIVPLIAGSALLVGYALAANNRPAGGQPLDLRDYQVGTIRAKRVEIMDEEWRIRCVLDVHRNRPVITFYDENGEPASVVVANAAGIIVGE